MAPRRRNELGVLEAARQRLALGPRERGLEAGHVLVLLVLDVVVQEVHHGVEGGQEGRVDGAEVLDLVEVLLYLLLWWQNLRV